MQDTRGIADMVTLRDICAYFRGRPEATASGHVQVGKAIFLCFLNRMTPPLEVYCTNAAACEDCKNHRHPGRRINVKELSYETLTWLISKDSLLRLGDEQVGRMIDNSITRDRVTKFLAHLHSLTY